MDIDINSGVNSLAGLGLSSPHLIKGKHSMKRDIITGTIITPMVPIHHVLPTELLAAIFKAGAIMPAHREEIPFPLLVCSICRHWRDIVINAPDVWTNIHWHVSLKPFPTVWFQRSKSCLLDITLHVLFWEEEDADISLLVRHVHRWRRFTIETVDLYDLVDLISPLRNVSAPCLEYAEFRATEADWADDMMQQHFLAGGTPSLRFVKLGNVCLQYSPPLVGVQTIDMHGWLPNASQLRLLSTASSLRKLVLRECMLMTEDVLMTEGEEEYSVVQIPSLLSLAISHIKSPPRHPLVYRSMLKYLSLPNLDYLEIVHATASDLKEHFPLGRQSPRYPKLQTLRLDNLQLSKGNMDDLFIRALPTVSHLQLVNTEGKHVLPVRSPSAPKGRESAPDTGGSNRWTNLHIITLEASPSFKDNLAWLCDTVSSRIDMGIPLGRVRLPCSCSAHPQLSAWLEDRVGIDVIGEDVELGIIRKEEEREAPSDPDSDSQGQDTPMAVAALPIMAERAPTIASTSVLPDGSNTAHMDTDIDFERDFGAWFDPSPQSTQLPPVQEDQPALPTSLFSSDFIQSVATSLDEFDPSIFRSDGDINFERDFGQWFNPDDVTWFSNPQLTDDGGSAGGECPDLSRGQDHPDPGLPHTAAARSLGRDSSLRFALGNEMPAPCPQPGTMAAPVLSDEAVQSVASSTDGFERDFAQWFGGDPAPGSLSLPGAQAVGSWAPDVFADSFVQSAAGSLDGYGPSSAGRDFAHPVHPEHDYASELQQLVLREQFVNAELLHVPPLILAASKQEAGLTGDEILFLCTLEEKECILAIARRKGTFTPTSPDVNPAMHVDPS